MGNYIAGPIVEKQREVQKEMQKEMQKVQLGKFWNQQRMLTINSIEDNMIRGQERMRRMMVAQQMAITRERVWWFVGFGNAMPHTQKRSNVLGTD